jgi:hypothetical protein
MVLQQVLGKSTKNYGNYIKALRWVKTSKINCINKEEKHIKGDLPSIVANLLHGFCTLQELRSLRFFLYLR